jgi:hypothetical protein
MLHSNVDKIGFPQQSTNRMVEEMRKRKPNYMTMELLPMYFYSVRIDDYSPRHWR